MRKIDKNPDTGRKDVEVLDFSKLVQGGMSDDFIITENNIYLEGEINPDSAKEITTYIIEANFPPENDTSVIPLDFINLFITSGGGCMESTFPMISVINASKIPIRTIALGTCASGGLMTAMSGHVRLVDQYCSIMSHTLSTGFPSFAKHIDLENWLAGVKVETEKIVELYVKKTELSEEFIKEHLLPSNRDVYLTAKQAIAHGMFDGYFTNFEDLK